ncbi:hypothetical protein [Shimia abyssi]|uniref:Glycerophosphoryl diester phosphodiesterase membrane domain-containing protein n=1 Tax=Shimia abyssi TaxID=1662395 RepID=A0A2P8F8E6_9RHOB|nr:hypothetical protein [Shimia abyssi]PSL17978.1 hypothetical protein CLV88_11349 [Shimia abyssi]
MGFKLLNHSLGLILGNLPQSLRLSSPLAALLLIALIVVGPSYFVQETSPEAATQVSGQSVLLNLLVAIATLWVAVAWHRFVLLEEYPSGVVPAFHGGRILAYFGYGLLLALIIALTAGVIGAIVGFALVWAPILMIAGLAVVAIGASWAFYRLSPVLPSAAIGNSMKLKEAWEATKPLSGAILGAMVIYVVAIFVLMFVGALIGGFIPILGGVLLLFANWFYILLGISFLTTLYGVAIEGRTID